MLRIEKGIPVSERNNYNDVPFSEMVVGDSVFVPLKDGQKMTTLQPTLMRAASDYAAQKDPEIKFTTKRWKDGNIVGVRIWRVK